MRQFEKLNKMLTIKHSKKVKKVGTVEHLHLLHAIKSLMIIITFNK